jgi:diguanylate cyclase (GGDEF)-like protein
MQLQALTGSLAFAISQSAVALVMFALFLAARRDLCTRYWAIASMLVATGVVIPFLFLGTILQLPSIWLGGSSILAGVVWMWWGARVFYRREPLPLGWWIIATGSALIAYAVFADATVFRVVVFASFVSLAIGLLINEVWRGDGSPPTVARKLVIGGVLLGVASLAVRAIGLALAGGGIYAYSNGTFNVLLLYMLPMAASFLCSVGMLLIYFEHMVSEKEHLANHDELTRLLNRRALTLEGKRMLREAGQSGQQVAVLIADIDHFKTFNDALGHDAGDRALTSVASALAAHCRKSDAIGRYGGEEFCVVCPDTDAAAAFGLGERLVGAIDALPPIDSAPRALSVSIGIASMPGSADDAAWDALVARADRALYDAKDAGRGRVTSAA